MAPARLARWAAPPVLLTAALAAAQPPTLQPAPQTPAAPPATTAPPPAATPPAPGVTPPKPPAWPKEIGGKPLSQWLLELTPAKNPDASQRDAAVRTLPLFGPDARKAALKPLCAVIDTDPDPGVRVSAILVLGGMGFDTRDEMRTAANALSELVGKTYAGSMVRLHAIRTLATFGPEAGSPDVIARVAFAANDPAWETRQAVAAALGRLGAPLYDEKPPPPSNPPKVVMPKQRASKVAMTKLLELTRDPSMMVRLEATQALLTLGPPNTPDPKAYVTEVKPFLDALAKQIPAEKDTGVKIWLLILNMMYDDRTFETLVPKVAAYVEHSDPAVRVHALNALSVLASRAQPALPEVRRALLQPDGTVVAAAVVCLVAMGDAGKPAIPDLEKLQASTKDPVIKELAKQAAESLKTGRKDVPAAAAMTKDEPKKDEMKKP